MVRYGSVLDNTHSVLFNALSDVGFTHINCGNAAAAVVLIDFNCPLSSVRMATCGGGG